MCFSNRVEPGDIRRYAGGALLRLLPVPRAELVLLRVEVFLTSRPDGGSFTQLVPGVDAPRRRQHRGQAGTDLRRRGPAVLQVLVQDVWRVGEEVPTDVRRCRTRQLT